MPTGDPPNHAPDYTYLNKGVGNKGYSLNANIVPVVRAAGDKDFLYKECDFCDGFHVEFMIVALNEKFFSCPACKDKFTAQISKFLCIPISKVLENRSNDSEDLAGVNIVEQW